MNLKITEQQLMNAYPEILQSLVIYGTVAVTYNPDTCEVKVINPYEMLFTELGKLK